VLGDCLQKDDILNGNLGSIVSDLIRLCGTVKTLEILSKADYSSKNRWLFCYYQHLSKDDIKQCDIDALVNLCSAVSYKDFVYHLDFLLEYECIESGFICKIIKIIADRSVTEPLFAHSLSFIFYDGTKINEQLFSLFKHNLEILEDIFILVNDLDHSVDYKGRIFSKLIDLNPNFISRYLEDKFFKKDCLTKNNDKRNYTFIWLRDDYLSVMGKISQIVYEHEKEGHCFGYFESFFHYRAEVETKENIVEKQDAFLSEEVRCKAADKKYMRLLFAVIATFNAARKLKFYQMFLGVNQNFDDFKKLPLEPSTANFKIAG
jgi:hypothetical protein